MATAERLDALASELRASLAVLRRVSGYYDTFENHPWFKERTTETAIILADVMVSFYTCLETMFVRISQFFENSLDASRWHKDLLKRMTYSVRGVRDRVISDESYAALSDLLAFRHFKRYYVEFEYDWDRLDLVRKKFLACRRTVLDEMNRYLEYVEKLAAAARSAGH